MKENAKVVLSDLVGGVHRYRFRILLASLLLMLAVAPLTVAGSSLDMVFGVALS